MLVIPVYIAIIILFAHFIADFPMQSDAMARGKSTSNWQLLRHILVYSIPFLLLFGWQYAFINAGIHGLVDYFTSRASKIQWEKGNVHNFFVVIGLDQFIHACTLLMIYSWMFLR